MGVEWSSWKMTRRPFGRKNCVYLIGGGPGSPPLGGAPRPPLRGGGRRTLRLTLPLLRERRRSRREKERCERHQRQTFPEHIHTSATVFESIAREGSTPVGPSARAFVRSVGLLIRGTFFMKLRLGILTRHSPRRK